MGTRAGRVRRAIGTAGVVVALVALIIPMPAGAAPVGPIHDVLLGDPLTHDVGSRRPLDLQAADLDGDGADELLAWGVPLDVLAMGPDGQYSTLQTVLTAVGDVGDVDGDGDLDVVGVGIQPSSVAVHLGNGDGTFTAGTEVLWDPRPQTALIIDHRLVDIDGDGDLDVVGASPTVDRHVYVLLGNGDGTFVPGPRTTLHASALSLQLGDLDQDGAIDIVETSMRGVGTCINIPSLPEVPEVCFDIGGLFVQWGNGDGTFAAPRRYGPPALLVDFDVADIDGDGAPSW